MQQAVSNGAKVIVEELCDNYRSNENMIRWFNDNYSKLFGAGNIIYSAMNYDDNTLSGDEGVISGAYYYKAPVTGKNYDEKCRAEAEAVVGIIQKLMKERKLYAKENGTRQKRDIRYSDFLILMRNTTDMNIYLDVFRENSIPVNWAGKEDVSGSLLLRKVQVVLRGLLHPYDWKESTGAKDILGDNKYTELMDATGQMDLNGKLQYLCDHLSYLVPEVSDAQEETTLRTQLNQMVETLYDAAGDDPAEVLDALSEYPDKPIEYELPLTEGDDAVRLMNVHKAKGLEGKIVILLNRRPEKKTHSSYLSVDKNGKYIWHGSIAAGVGNAAVLSIQNIDGSEDQKDCENQEQAENLRLEYVAGTRAEEALIVMSELSPDKRCFFGGCNPDTRDGYEYDKNYIIPPKEIEEDKSDNQTATKKVEEIKEYSETIPAKETNLSPSFLEHQESETGRDGEPAFTEDRPRGNVFGTVMHRAFELSVNALRQDSYDVKGTVETAVRQAIIENYEELEREGQSNRHRNEAKDPFTPQDVHDFLVEKIQNVLNAKGLLQEITNAKAVYTELPFSFYKKGSDPFFEDLKPYLEKKKIDIALETDVWINGSSDLVIQKADGTWLIIDYKSDQKKDDLSEQDFNRQLHDDRYAGQLLLYRKALAEVEDGVKAEDIETKIVDLY